MYVTILARNYLPKALALAASLARHEPGERLRVLLIDVDRDADLPDLAGSSGLDNVVGLSTEALGLDRREVQRLATIYDLVEFATAIKPALFRELLAQDDWVTYLDPDTWATAPLSDLGPALAASEGGILLTPHFLEPTPSPYDEGHLLTVGVFNLGFVALDRRALPFLDWWWSHLRDECLFDYAAGLFVDQKWVDIGSVLFRAAALRHPGYNVGVANLHERPLGRDGEAFVVESTGDPLRLFHFHAFDPDRPDLLSVRAGHDVGPEQGPVVRALCAAYAEDVLRHRAALPVAPAYPYLVDTRGHRISRQTRRAYRLADAAGERLPSPFEPAEAEAWESWRRGAWPAKAKGLVGDAARSVRVALPEEYDRLRKRFPALARGAKGRLSGGGGIWR